MIRAWVSAIAIACACSFAAAQTEIRMMAGSGFGIPPKEATSTNATIRRAVFEEFQKKNPDVRVVNAGGLSMTGDNADNVFLMSMAGDRAPDVFYVNFRQYYTYLEQGFCRSLDDVLAANPDIGSRINPAVKQVLTSFDGKIYAIPFFQVAIALYYRKDFFLEAGLDPASPPKTWDELYEYALKLRKKDRFGFGLSTPPGYPWQNFVYQAGGEVVGPAENGRWKSLIGTPEAAKAVDMFRRLVLPQNGNPAVGTISTDLTDEVNKGKIAMWFSYTYDVLMASSEVPPSVLGIAALPAGPAGSRNEVNAGMWAINARVTDPKKLDACVRFIKFFAGD